jgi:uncharacterized protein
MLKSSRFNFWASINDNEEQHLLFNGISGALYELDAQERIWTRSFLDVPDKSLNSNSLNPKEADLRRSLIEGGFVIPDDVDEIEMLLTRNQLECIDHHILDLVIAPTYGCNFRCTYCYVDFNAKRISADVEERVVKYVERVLPQYQQVNISWFGGEPLLCLDAVLRVSRQITEIAHRYYEVRLYNFISTNGYLLNLETAHKLFEAGIRFFHITIDGLPRYHDQRRVLANGNPTYTIIKENLVNMLTNIPDAHITLRSNVDESNIDSLHEVLDEIPATFRRRIQVNITPVRNDDKTPSVKLYQKINHVTRYALEIGYLYSDIPIPINRRTFCAADKFNNFQIGWDGTLYKCSPATNKPEVKVGHLNAQGLQELNQNYEVWHKAPLMTDHCFDCPYLCFCAGGCRLERLRGAQELSCRDEYRDIGNLIINRYMAILNNAFEVKIEDTSKRKQVKHGKT